MAADGDVHEAPSVPGFELGRVLGRGTTSEVWEGVREADGRRVAVKVTRADHESVAAAAHEASLAAAVASAHVVAVEACLPLPDGRVALVMPLVRGGDLAGLVAARGFLAPGEVVTVLAPVAAALGRLHASGAVHGDVSPGNVLLELDGRPLLADLGLGRVVGEEPTAVWGTDGYVAPEVLMGAYPSAESDVYALGALGWLCLTGGPPGPPGLRPPLEDVSRAGEDAAALVEVVSSAVAAHADERPTAAELAWALFGAAEARPLHLVSGGDEVTAVTYRLRAAAGAEATDVPRRRGRHARGPTRRPWRAGAVVLGAAAVLVGGGVVALDRPWEAAPAPDVPGATSGSSSTPASSSASPTSLRTRPTAPAEDPVALLTVLADARAAAWRAADPVLLAGAEAAGSALRARDTAALAELVRSGARYVGLRYRVTEAALVEADGRRALLRARVDTEGYQVVGGDSRGERAPVPGGPVLVELRWTADGWRMADLRPTA